ncbi:LOW QUALITY PROTEIN: leukotriene A-4 hydrolase [Pectinophora gossypiella]|uniref:LOW QUALITY PROTEIN: leukotriene A-4 hydrolase n=1 Tax=Pectinophora gossypiella TaxID=13191 RepID=UPI00214E22CF|nr:LOW QUALITY PROTEIN: leukotriene A-4 hydrolase [Pectinophora gossypiella]
MSNPGKLVTRVFRLGYRFSLLSRNPRTCSVLGANAFYHSCVPKIQNRYSLAHIIYKNFVGSCQVRTMSGLSPNDPSSYSRPEYVVIRHASLDLDVDFGKKVLQGTALLKFEALQDIDEVVLDVSNQTIHSVELENGTELNYKIDGHIANFGSRLTITLPNLISPPEKFNVRIKYTTSPTASALQWLDPNQTSGKQFPYLFSQCQPIHARSILPCQDTPAVKFTYDAVVTAPEMFTVLMSAIRDQKKVNKTSFNQPVPVPSYLLAIAIGVLDSKRLGPRTVVWSEKEEIERSAWEFADTEKFLQAAERLCGPYQWTEYDLLVLPPSFPYGGMENPCLTFVTPTLLSGDRSQADVIVHEIMHSWTGNLITNKNFEHFWLNEGFTVFLERKVAASLIADPAEAKKSRDFHSLLGLQELTEAVKEQFTPNDPLTRLVPDLNGIHPDDSFSRVPYEKGSLFLRYLEDLVGGPGKQSICITNIRILLVNDELGATSPLTNLVVDLKGVNPDDAFSTVPYEKGSLFLRYLEDLTGGPEVFDAFLRSYLDHFQRRSLDTDQFKAYLLSYFKGNSAEEKLRNVDWQTWLYTPGMPPVIPSYDTSMTQAVSGLIKKIYSLDTQLSHDDVKHFTPHQIINLLQEMIERSPLTVDRLETLGSEYNISDSKNAEIKYRWLRLCAKSKNQPRLPEILKFVNEQGRMKFVRPLYRDLYAWEEVRQQAIDNFLNNEKFMMHVSAYTVRKDLHL